MGLSREKWPWSKLNVLGTPCDYLFSYSLLKMDAGYAFVNTWSQTASAIFSVITLPIGLTLLR